jgi:hypothetical protein
MGFVSLSHDDFPFPPRTGIANDNIVADGF